MVVSWTLILFSGGSRGGAGGGRGGGWLPPPPIIFRPEQPKKLFWGDQAPPPHPYLRVCMTRLSFISRSGFSTAFVLGTKHLIGGDNKTYRCNRTAVKTLRLRFLGKLFLKLIPARRLYLVGLWGTKVALVFIFHKTCMLGTPDTQFQGF